MHSAKTFLKLPFHLSISHSLVLFPYFQNDTLHRHCFSHGCRCSWSQKYVLFSLNCVSVQAEEQKPSGTSGSSLVLSPSFYPLSLCAFPEKEAMLLPAEPAQTQFHHLILLETGTLTGLANHELTWHNTESWSWDQYWWCGELSAWVCYGQQCRADAKASSSCWSSREHFHGWDWLWTWKVCPRATWRHGVVGPSTLITGASSPLAVHELETSAGSSACVEPPSDTATQGAQARKELIWYPGQPQYQPA